MDASGDEFWHVIPERATKHAPHKSFEFDDAFGDDDRDLSTRFTINSEAIREEFAARREAEAIANEGYAQGNLDDQSVSTIDIGGPALSVEAEGVYETPSPSVGGSELSNDFSRVSLSDHSHHTSEPEQEAERDIPVTQPEAAYPTVHIDASEHPPFTAVQEIELKLPQDSSHLVPEPHPSESLNQSRTPPHSAPASSSNTSFSVPPPNDPPTSPIDVHSTPQDKRPKHRPTQSMVGPSTLEKVMSRTRPTYLPPKSKDEDNKHMADWENIMRRSRAAEEKRRKALAERRLARERKIEESLYIWEKNIVPDWRVVYKNPELRKLWWSGIPSKLRGTMWERAIGNALALGKDNFRTCSARARRALSSNTFPQAALDLIESDILGTLPSLHIFHPATGPLYQDLKDMLCAWVVSRTDEGLGYTFGVARIAGMLLVNMPPERGFIVLRNLLERHCMRSFYGGDTTKEDVEAYFRIFDTLLADGMPKIYFNFKQHQISPVLYLPDWLLPLFLDHLPFEACARIWDVFMLEGDAFLYRASLGILAILEPRLFFPDRQELLDLLGGRNKAALEVARRDGRPLDGGKYEIYGVDEETLWDRIDNMNDWWKDSTWTRLIHRELPDL